MYQRGNRLGMYNFEKKEHNRQENSLLHIQGPRSNKWKLGNVLKGKKEYTKKGKIYIFCKGHKWK